ncbi:MULTISPECIES: helix-turn-helix transcriptional regulator [Microbacterium]|uniref:helix-turn-helix transcriptional regulator n=1 Tax=Microbacterium TaxID=33882 RepID=UPI00217DE541|nr:MULTISPECIES: helix-turn-helix domain-containing protein [Microbacterium]UWF77240.1 helix-turn-helix domain-containing protein [Microbacterium neungamense]WCM55395.1 helix-turn-helix domain-containing protein [Microbacterium sp. EF45047]
MDVSSRAARIGSLADATRRAIYDHVVAQEDPVGREAVAAALDIPVHMARFHLDKLVDAGLLETEFRRLSGRSGPGAGRPSKLYRRVAETIAVSLPERRYDLVGHLLARAIERADEGRPVVEAVGEVAREEGRRAGATASAAVDPADAADAADELARAACALEAQGYEPRTSDAEILLANCPFDSLAREHTALICAANHSYVDGMLDGLGCARLRADLDRGAGRCCVAVRSSASGSG